MTHIPHSKYDTSIKELLEIPLVQIKNNMKYIIIVTIVAVLGSTAMYFGQDLTDMFGSKVQYVTQVEKEVVVTDEFAELVRQFKESSEGQEVLNVWATQKALDATREKLDEIEKQTLTKEASL